MQVCVVGAGFVGLVTSVYMATLGHIVSCVDKDETKVKLINSGKLPFHEAGLKEALAKVLDVNLSVTDDLIQASLNAEYVFVCVGTPTSRSGGIDLSFLEAVVSDLSETLKHTVTKGKTFIVKSTVVPGTTRKLFIEQMEARSGKTYGADFFVAMNPEFLREGSAVDDAFNPDRVIVGADNVTTTSRVLSLFSDVPSELKISVGLETAEMCKYLSNMFFASLISFSNEIARLCESVPGVQPDALFRSLYFDRRLSVSFASQEQRAIGASTYLWPGVGFGGSCFPKDVEAISNFGLQNDVATPLLDSVLKINKSQTSHLLNRLFENFSFDSATVLGLSFKPETDDIRDSKSLEIISALLNRGIPVSVYDPLVKTLPEGYDVTHEKDLMTAIKNSSLLIIATSWDVFKSEKVISNILREQPVVLDCRLFLSSYSDKIVNYMGPGIYIMPSSRRTLT